MTTKEKVEEIEGKLAVDQITVEKFGRQFQIYPWLKGRLFHKHITGHETMQKKDLNLVLKQLISVFYGLWNLIGKYDIWAFTSSSERRLIDGKYHDKLFDLIGNESGKKTLLIELRLFKYYRYKKVASRRVISKSIFIFLEEFYGRFILRLPKVQNQKILDDLNAEFDEGISEDEVVRKYLSQYKMMRFWLKILPNPKVVFISVAYTNFGYIRAFKEKGIKVVEFQHGLVTTNHSGYFYKKKFESIQFPDEMVSISESEVEVFNGENAFPLGEVFPVGSFIIDHYLGNDKRSGSSNSSKVLLTFQDGVIGDKLADFVAELSSKVGDEVELIIQTRRTPSEHYAPKFKGLKNISFSEIDFYSALIDCDVHATVYSTTAIEALSLGRPNLLINIDNLSVEQLSSKLGDNEFTTIVNDVDSFVVALAKCNNIDKQNVIDSNRSQIKPGYKQNILDYVNQLNLE